MRYYIQAENTANSQDMEINMKSIAGKLKGDFVIIKLKEASLRYTSTTSTALGSATFNISLNNVRAVNVINDSEDLILTLGAENKLEVATSAKLAVYFVDNDNTEAVIPRSYLEQIITLSFNVRLSNTTIATYSSKNVILEIRDLE